MQVTFVCTIPFLISFLTGFLLIDLLFLWKDKPPIATRLFLSGGLGLGLSSLILFFGFVLFDQLNTSFAILTHTLFLGLLLVLKIITLFPPGGRKHLNNKKILSDRTFPGIKGFLFLGLITPFIIPLLSYIKYFHPYGGWDAWSVWNFKAKFLLLSGPNWSNIFDPILWRSSPHYPLLLPLINVWGWIFTKQPVSAGPALTSLIFTFLMAGLLFSGLRYSTKNNAVILAPLLLLTLSFYEILATSQYCDLIVGYYLLASFYCLIETARKESPAFAFLAGLFIGLLSFTKPEGTIAAILIAGLSLIHCALNVDNRTQKIKLLLFLGGGIVLFSIPTIIFYVFYSPGNQTFLNGLPTPDKLAELSRMGTTLTSLLAELKEPRWNGLWFLIITGLFFSWKKCFRKEIIVFPLFLLFYLTIIVFYYFVNTYFEVQWWLDQSLNRILFSLLPLIVFWTFYSLFSDNKKPTKHQ